MNSKIKIARLRAGLSRPQMHEVMGIPVRTIENWEGGQRECPEWAERLIIAELNRIAARQSRLNK